MLQIHGMTATVKRLSEECRAVVTRAFTGRTAVRTALAHGLPKEAIRSVLDGHDPRVSRADDVCRALGITFLLGGALDEDAGAGTVRDARDPGKTAAPPELHAQSGGRLRGRIHTPGDALRWGVLACITLLPATPFVFTPGTIYAFVAGKAVWSRAIF